MDSSTTLLVTTCPHDQLIKQDVCTAVVSRAGSGWVLVTGDKIIQIDGQYNTEWYRPLQVVPQYWQIPWRRICWLGLYICLLLRLLLLLRFERIQKICVNIILCDSEWEIPYFVGCTLLGLEPLSFRRTDLCIRFAQKTSQDPRHADLFVRNTNQFYTRQDKPLYRDYQRRTWRFFKSPLCYLTRLLNMYPAKDNEKKA